MQLCWEEVRCRKGAEGLIMRRAAKRVTKQSGEDMRAERILAVFG
jgi:hypothetical protein